MNEKIVTDYIVETQEIECILCGGKHGDNTWCQASMGDVNNG